jgi:predicted DCC family thiol-disulfide oxidoreductase YuxK
VSDVEASRPVVLFDGACGFCTWCVLAEKRYVRSGLAFIPYQRADLATLGVSAAQAAESVQFVVDGRVLAGARAVAAVLRNGRLPWPVIGGLLDAPAVRPLAERGYRFVARHRGRLPWAPPAIDQLN